MSQICAICGRQIHGKTSADHVFPRALYKWSEYCMPADEYNRIKSLIDSPDNITRTHAWCNKRKEERNPVIDLLYIGDGQKKALKALEGALTDTTQYYMENKQKILARQNNRCICCGKTITDEGVLRRMDPSKNRIWDNACVVCHKCNTDKPDFKKEMEKQKINQLAKRLDSLPNSYYEFVDSIVDYAE